MKYVILIHHNPESQKIWESFSADERAEGLKVYTNLNEDLAASGELIVTEALAYPSEGRRLPAREGSAIPSDGPYAEVKEYLAGFYLVDCDGMDRALEIAARIPESGLGLVELRPVMDLAAFEL
jgi:hypothetical protein